MTKHIITAALLCCVVAAPLYAQQSNENTLGNLWPKVEENYSGIQSKNKTIEAARLNEEVSKANKLPQINVQAQNTYGTYEGSAGAFFPQAGFFNVSGSAAPQNGSSTAANTFGSTVVQWEAFSFGRLKKQNEAAEILSNKAISEKDSYILNLKKALSDRYISLLYTNAKLDWKQKSSERLLDIKKITSGLAASGLRPAADSLLALSSFIQARGEFDKWTGIEKASFIKLQEFYGNEELAYASSAKRFLNPVQGNSNRSNFTHPFLNVLEQQTNFHLLNADIQKRTAFPSINLLAGYSFRSTAIGANGRVSGDWASGFNNPTHNILAGIGITWSITNLHTSRLRSNKLLKDAESSKLLQTQYEQAIEADLGAVQAKISAQYQQIQKTKLAVEQSIEAYQMYLARYKSGLIALSELLQISALLENAENAHIEASNDYWALLSYEAELTANFDFLFNNL